MRGASAALPRNNSIFLREYNFAFNLFPPSSPPFSCLSCTPFSLSLYRGALFSLFFPTPAPALAPRTILIPLDSSPLPWASQTLSLSLSSALFFFRFFSRLFLSPRAFIWREARSVRSLCPCQPERGSPSFFPTLPFFSPSSTSSSPHPPLALSSFLLCVSAPPASAARFFRLVLNIKHCRGRRRKRRAAAPRELSLEFYSDVSTRTFFLYIVSRSVMDFAELLIQLCSLAVFPSTRPRVD